MTQGLPHPDVARPWRGSIPELQPESPDAERNEQRRAAGSPPPVLHGRQLAGVQRPGQGPQRFLVFPRVLALLIVLPVLTIVGDLVGSAGGLAIAVSYLDQPTVA